MQNRITNKIQNRITNKILNDISKKYVDPFIDATTKEVTCSHLISHNEFANSEITDYLDTHPVLKEAYENFIAFFKEPHIPSLDENKLTEAEQNQIRFFMKECTFRDINPFKHPPKEAKNTAHKALNTKEPTLFSQSCQPTNTKTGWLVADPVTITGDMFFMCGEEVNRVRDRISDDEIYDSLHRSSQTEFLVFESFYQAFLYCYQKSPHNVFLGACNPDDIILECSGHVPVLWQVNYSNLAFKKDLDKEYLECGIKFHPYHLSYAKATKDMVEPIAATVCYPRLPWGNFKNLGEINCKEYELSKQSICAIM